MREALKEDLILLLLILFRRAKYCEDVKKYCLEYAENQIMLDQITRDDIDLAKDDL